jgi:hypothetical protein
VKIHAPDPILSNDMDEGDGIKEEEGNVTEMDNYEYEAYTYNMNEDVDYNDVLNCESKEEHNEGENEGLILL